MHFVSGAIWLILMFCALSNAWLRRQSLCVHGRVKCTVDEVRTAHVVKLWDEDDGPNPDDLMADSITLSDGSFSLCGEAGEISGTIDPIFKIYTHCGNQNERDRRCFRKLSFPISQSYVGGNYTFPEPIELSNRTTTEQRRCFTGSQWSDMMKRYTGSTPREWWLKLTGDNASGIMKVLVTAAALLDERPNNTATVDISQ